MCVKLLPRVAIVGFLTCLIVLVDSVEPNNAKEVLDRSNDTAISEKKPSYDVSFFSDELSWKNGFEQALAVGGIIIGSLVVLGGLAWLVAPVFGYRICTVFGNCETAALTHSNGGNLQDPGQVNAYPDAYNSVISPYVSGYRKRSLKYVGPLLKTLASAYEKFEQQSSTSTKTN